MVCSFSLKLWVVACVFSLSCIGEIAAEDHLYRFWDDGLVGYMDATGTVVLPATFPDGQDFRNGQAVVLVDAREGAERWAVIDMRGDYRIGPTRDRPIWFHEGRWVFRRHGAHRVGGTQEWLGDGRYLADDAGEPVGEGEAYRMLYALQEARAAVFADGGWGCLDLDGQMVIEPRFVTSLFFNDGVAIALADGGYGIVDMAGDWLVEPIYDEMSIDFTDGLAFAVQGDRWGVVDTEGNWVRALDYPLPHLINGGLARIEEISPLVIDPELFNHPYFFVNLEGERSAFTVEDDSVFFREGMLAIVREGKIGYINEDFEIVIPCQFQHPDPDGHDHANPWAYRVDFRDGIAAVMMDGQWGYIDRAGNWVIEPQFVEAQHFRGELALVKDDETVGYINRAGEYIWRVPLEETVSDDLDRHHHP